MALSDEIKEQRKHLKGKGPKAYLQYFWDYYKIPTLVVIVGGGMAFSLISSVINYKAPAFYAMFLNAADQDGYARSEIQEGFRTYAGIDEGEEIIADMSLWQTPGSSLTSSMDLAASAKLDALLFDGRLDVLVCDAWNYRRYASIGVICDLREILTEAQLEQFKDRIWYVDMAEFALDEPATEPESETEMPYVSAAEAEAWESAANWVMPDPADMEDPAPAGIVLDGSPVLEKGEQYEDLYGERVCIAGFPQKMPHPELAPVFLEYLLEEG